MSMAIASRDLLQADTYGRSSAADYIKKALRLVKAQRNESRFLEGWRTDLKNEILEFADQCKNTDWDGEGALPISASITESAQRFVDLLPDAIFLPSLFPDNDGGYTFEWMEDREFILSISIIDEYLIYAGIFGDDRLKGKTRIQDELPEQIIKPLQKFFTKKTKA